VIDHEEQFWIRGLSQVAIEQNGFFASSDVGAATTFTFPKKYGGFYARSPNGPRLPRARSTGSRTIRLA
jgi:hypothetical protein